MKQNLNIMIVDDHKVYRKSLKMMLQKLFPESTLLEAENGCDFLEKIEIHSIDLVLMDIQMPLMNGFEATNIAHKKYPHLRILGISMFASIDDQFKLKEFGALGFIAKDKGFSTIKKGISTVLKGEEFFPELDFHHQ